MTSKVQILLGLFSNPTEKWQEYYPTNDPKVAYIARETSLISQSALFCCMYELWSELNVISIDRTDPRMAALAQLRMLIQVVFDVGSVEHVSWQIGESDRWDDYWTLLHNLAVQAGGASYSLHIFNFQNILFNVEVREVKNHADYLKLKRSWKDW